MRKQLHIVLFPAMAQGHMIPMLDMAKLFISRNLKTTIISTTGFSDPVKRARDSGHEIGLRILNFPPQGSELPYHITSLDQVMTEHLFPLFIKALPLLQKSFEKLLQEINPDVIVSNKFMPWTVDSAEKIGIPRIVFHGTSNFSSCAREQLEHYKPYKNLSSNSDTFVLPDLPHELTFIISQVSPFELMESDNVVTEFLEQQRKSNMRSYGVIVNSFYELESGYVNRYRSILGCRAWQIGPLSLLNQGMEEKGQRGRKSSIDVHECLAWLDSKRPESVVYMCFGSIVDFSSAQLHEIAIGLEASGQNFIWVLRETRESEDWIPEGFEMRTIENGLIIRGWAPQVMILDHVAIGAFVTHCGWNSTLESICAGVPMVTWPVCAEQFYNEKMIVDILKVGVSVGNKKWMLRASEGVSSEALARALKDVMMGEEAVKISFRARDYKEMAKKSIEEGGSSWNGLNELIEELSAYSHPKRESIQGD